MLNTGGYRREGNKKAFAGFEKLEQKTSVEVAHAS
jgi:hypothetical protein